MDSAWVSLTDNLGGILPEGHKATVRLGDKELRVVHGLDVVPVVMGGAYVPQEGFHHMFYSHALGISVFVEFNTDLSGHSKGSLHKSVLREACYAGGSVRECVDLTGL